MILPPPPRPPASCLSFSVFLCVACRAHWRGGGRREAKKHYEGEEACVGIFKQSVGARNRVGIGLLYRPYRLRRLAELIPWNRLLGAITWKFGLRSSLNLSILSGPDAQSVVRSTVKNTTPHHNNGILTFCYPYRWGFSPWQDFPPGDSLIIGMDSKINYIYALRMYSLIRTLFWWHF